MSAHPSSHGLTLVVAAPVAGVPNAAPLDRDTIEAQDAIEAGDWSKVSAISARKTAKAPAEGDAAPETGPLALPKVPATLALESGSFVEIARRTLDIIGDSDRVTYDDGAVYRYSDDTGLWHPLDHDWVNCAISRFDGCPVLEGGRSKPLKLSPGVANQARAQVYSTLRARSSRALFANAVPGIAFSNVFVMVRGGQIEERPHASEHLARVGHGFAYDPFAECPRWLAHLDLVFGNRDADERAKIVALLQEFTGAALIGEATKHQKALVLFSENNGGGEGKSTTLNVLRSVFPDGTTASLEPHLWNTRFQLQMLVGKRANFVNELPGTDLRSADKFKAVVSGDEQTIERKHRDAFQMTPCAGHFLACNQLPGTEDHSDGFFRRALLLPFSRQLYQTADRTLAVDREIIEAERAGVVAWALEGAARLQRQPGYTVPDCSAAAVAAWRQESDAVLRFLIENPITGTTPARDIYRAFCVWADENNHKKPSGSTFGRRLSGTKLLLSSRSGLVRYWSPKPPTPGSDGKG